MCAVLSLATLYDVFEATISVEPYADAFLSMSSSFNTFAFSRRYRFPLLVVQNAQASDLLAVLRGVLLIVALMLSLARALHVTRFPFFFSRSVSIVVFKAKEDLLLSVPIEASTRRRCSTALVHAVSRVHTTPTIPRSSKAPANERAFHLYVRCLHTV